jgi:hypothetical protein
VHVIDDIDTEADLPDVSTHQPCTRGVRGAPTPFTQEGPWRPDRHPRGPGAHERPRRRAADGGQPPTGHWPICGPWPLSGTYWISLAVATVGRSNTTQPVKEEPGDMVPVPVNAGQPLTVSNRSGV